MEETPGAGVRWPLPDYPDFEAEGLFDGLEGSDREARRQLLEYLIDSGISLRDLKSEARADRLALIPADLKLGLRRRTLTPTEISQETGLSVEDFQKLVAALGFPKPEPGQMTFGEEDLAAARRMKKFQEAGISTEGILALTRQVGSGTARIAQAYRDLVASDLVDPGSNEFEVAMTLRDAAEELFPLGEQALSYALRSHFIDQVRGDVIEAAEPGWLARADAVEVSVCFADLVGFTRLGERSELERIGSVTALLESVAIEVTNPEVRLVKLVGDAAMMVSEDGGAIFDAALRFIEVGEEAGEDLPALRVGVARGQAIQQVGDWFGHPVNLASRITETARPGSVLAEATAVEAGGDRFSYSTAGRHKFKGMSKPVELFRVRRKPEDLSEPEWLP